MSYVEFLRSRLNAAKRAEYDRLNDEACEILARAELLVCEIEDETRRGMVGELLVSKSDLEIVMYHFERLEDMDAVGPVLLGNKLVLYRDGGVKWYPRIVMDTYLDAALTKARPATDREDRYFWSVRSLFAITDSPEQMFSAK
jgi:hypothetical protein